MKLIEFYVNKIKYTEGVENADLSFINPILRRRLSLLDRVSAASLHSCFNEKIQNIVFYHLLNLLVYQNVVYHN